MRNAALILIDKEGKIDGISSTCITLLKLDLQYITKKKTNIKDIIP